MKQKEKSKGLIICDYKGKWKEELKKRLQKQEKITLTALGKVIKLETKYKKTKEKGLGLKITVKRLTPAKKTKVTQLVLRRTDINANSQLMSHNP